MGFFFRDDQGRIRKIGIAPEDKPKKGQITYNYRPNVYDAVYTDQKDGKYFDHKVSELVSNNLATAKRMFAKQHHKIPEGKIVRFEERSKVEPEKTLRNIAYDRIDDKTSDKHKQLSRINITRPDDNVFEDEKSSRFMLRKIKESREFDKQEHIEDPIDKILDQFDPNETKPIDLDKYRKNKT